MSFDTIIDRKGTRSLKWENVRNEQGKPDVIPLWVADMDFAPPSPVLAALRSRTEHPIFGYTNTPLEYFEALSAWYKSRYGAVVRREAILLGPGLIPTLGISIRSLTAAGDGVLVMPPVYHPFFDIVRDNDRVIVEAPLEHTGGQNYRLDLEAAGRAIDEAAKGGLHTTAILFSSPHNPGGRVWSAEELASLVAFAEKRSLSIISDEIHGDLIMGKRKFTSLAAFPAAAERTVVLSAPNKTFNLAGLHLSHLVVEDDRLRAQVKRGIAAAGYSQPNVLSLTAALAAYREGGAWVDELIAYLRGNIDYAVNFVNSRIPGAVATAPEGTYLVWADVSALAASLGLKDGELAPRLEDQGRVKFTAGSVFGTGGSGFVRINVACPRAILSEGLERFATWAAMSGR